MIKQLFEDLYKLVKLFYSGAHLVILAKEKNEQPHQIKKYDNKQEIKRHWR